MRPCAPVSNTKFPSVVSTLAFIRMSFPTLVKGMTQETVSAVMMGSPAAVADFIVFVSIKSLCLSAQTMLLALKMSICNMALKPNNSFG